MSDNRLFEATMESFPDGIIIADSNNKIVFVNTAAEEIRILPTSAKLNRKT
jgi:PAS domain S-box-containing protein